MDYQKYYRYIEDNMEPIPYGYKCKLCKREITHSNSKNNRGNGFMKISMVGHLKKHWREQSNETGVGE